MLVRRYEERDLEELRRIHAAQGFGYAFPDLSDPLFLTRLVLVEDEAGREEAGEKEQLKEGAPNAADPGGSCCAPANAGQRVIGAALLRLTAEAYLLLDPKVGTPRERWGWLLGLHAATERDAARRGLEDVHAWLPPEIAGKFGKRLVRLGWIRDDVWTPYCRRLATSDR